MTAGGFDRPGPGALRDRVEIRRRITTDEDEGGEAALFVPVATVWARVRALTARPGEAIGGRAVSITHSVVLRYRADIAPGDRLVARGQNLEVIGAADLNGRRAWLGCTCTQTAVTG